MTAVNAKLEQKPYYNKRPYQGRAPRTRWKVPERIFQQAWIEAQRSDLYHLWEPWVAKDVYHIICVLIERPKSQSAIKVLRHQPYHQLLKRTSKLYRTHDAFACRTEYETWLTDICEILPLDLALLARWRFVVALKTTSLIQFHRIRSLNRGSILTD